MSPNAPEFQSAFRCRTRYDFRERVTHGDFAKPTFHLRRIVGTPAALQVIVQTGQSPTNFLERPVRGEWGELCDEDRELNDQAVTDGSRIMSVYRTHHGQKIWVVTEAADDCGQRAATTILLPNEYWRSASCSHDPPACHSPGRAVKHASRTRPLLSFPFRVTRFS